MNYQAYTNDSLTMMHEAVRSALAADDGLKATGPPSPIPRSGKSRLEKLRR